MNKRMKGITAFLLMLTMAFSGSYAFAETTDQPSDDPNQAATGVTEEEAPLEDVLSEEAVPFEEDSQDMMAMSEPGASLEFAGEGAVANKQLLRAANDNSITATTVNYTTTSVPDPEMYDYPATSSGCATITVNVNTSGKLWLLAHKVSGSGEAIVFVGKYDPNTNNVDYSYTAYATMNEGDTVDGIGGLDVVSGGSYCIGISSASSGTIQVLPYVYSYATRSLSVNKIMLTEGYKTTSNGVLKDTSAMFTIKPGKTGYIIVDAVEYGRDKSAGSVTLLNSKKKAVSDKLSYNSKSNNAYVVFGVKKGTTYYLKVSGFQGTEDEQYCYGIRYKNYSAALRSNTVKKKATNLKRKAKYIAASMPATDKGSSQWYKFNVKKKQKTQIRIDASYLKSGKTTATIYCGKKKIGTETVTKGKVITITVTNSNKKGIAKKGTYYVKISRSAKANGQYKIRYLK